MKEREREKKEMLERSPLSKNRDSLPCFHLFSKEETKQNTQTFGRWNSKTKGTQLSGSTLKILNRILA